MLKRVERTPELKEKIKTLYLERGESLSAVARAIDVSRETLKLLMKDYDIPQRKKQDQSGPNHYNWKGGIIWRAGYAFVYAPGHHRAQHWTRHNHVKRADIVLEKKLGRQLLPNEVTHHINGDKSDDRPENLEVKTITEHTTHHNREKRDRRILRRNNVTGEVGVSWDSINKKFLASIYANGKNITIGRFDSLDDAKAARKQAEEDYW